MLFNLNKPICTSNLYNMYFSIKLLLNLFFNLMAINTRLLNSSNNYKVIFRPQKKTKTLKNRNVKFKVFMKPCRQLSRLTSVQKSLIIIDKANYYWNNKSESYQNHSLSYYRYSSFRTEKSMYKKSLKRFIKKTKVDRKTLKLTNYLTSTLTTLDPVKLKYSLNLKFFRNSFKKRKKINKKFLSLLSRNSKVNSSKTIKSKRSRFWRYLFYRFRRRKDKRFKYRERRFTKLLRYFTVRKRRMKNTKRSIIRKKFTRVIKKSRKLFRSIMGLRSKNKNRLINKVKSFNHKSISSKILSVEMSPLSILLRTSFLNSVNDALFFINNNLVYLNGKSISSNNLILSPGDRLQLPITKSTLKWFSISSSNKYQGFKKVVRLFYRKKFNTRGRFKKRSRRYPKWLMRYSNMGYKVPLLLEVDYLTLSVIVLYKPCSMNEFSSLNSRWINLNSHSLYLWRYIN